MSQPDPIYSFYFIHSLASPFMHGFWIADGCRRAVVWFGIGLTEAVQSFSVDATAA